MTVRNPSIQTTSRTWLAYIALVALLTVLCFSGVADLGIDTHDADTFRDHERIAQDFSFFFSPDKDQPTGRPTIELVKYLAYLAWGNDPGIFHLLVVFFHALASLLLARTAHHLGASLGLSMLGGLLFLVNVAHFQAVYWISALDYPVALICSLGAVTCYVDYDRGAAPARLRLYAFHAILVLGVLAHPSVVAAWLFCLYWAWRQSTDLKEIARRLLPFAALLLPTALLALHLSPRSASTWSLVDMPITESVTVLLGMLRMLLWLVSRLLTTAHWLPLPVYKFQTWELILGAVVLAGLVYPIWKKRDPQAHWAMWTLLSFPPFLLLTETTILGLPAGPSRYVYQASAGSAMLLAWIVDALRLRLGKMGGPVGAVVLLAVLGSSFFYLQKAEAVSRYTSGRFHLTRGDVSTGTAQLRRAIKDGADIIDLEDAYVRLVMADIRNPDALDPDLRRARELFPDNMLFVIASLVLDSLGPDPQRRHEAQSRLAELKLQDTGNTYWTAQLYDNAGAGFYDREKWDRAIEAYRSALQYDSARIDTRVRLGWVLVMTDRFAQAIAECETVLQQVPHSAAHFNLGLAHMLRGDSGDSRAAYAAAMERHGRDEAERLGVLHRLQRLVTLDIRAAEARGMMNTYWPENAGF